MGKRTRPTVRDIAVRARVSPATVSAALQPAGTGASVGADTRRKILDAAEALGYDYSRLRRRLHRTTTVALFCPANTHPNVSGLVYAELLELSERFAHHGIHALVQSGHGVTGRDAVAAGELFRKGEADGAVVLSMWDWAAHMPDWDAPSVFLGPAPGDVPLCQVNVDDELGGRLAAEHLWSLGHRSVGMVHMWPNGWGSDRERGFRSAWAQRGVEIPEAASVALPDTTEESVVGAVRALLGTRHATNGRITALFCDADWVASHAIRAARSMGLGVPDDVSVMGFDDAAFATMMDPPLTTVRQPVRELAALAASLLVEQMRLGQPMTTTYRVPCELVARGTTAPVRE